MTILLSLLTALVVGLLARLLMPGRQNLPTWATVALGIFGSIVAKLVCLLLGIGDGGSFIGAILGAVFILWLVNFLRGRGVL